MGDERTGPPGPPPDLRDRMRAVFDSVAETYDHVGVDFFGPIAEGLVGELGVTAGERAADIGCGRGAALFPLAQAVGDSGRVTGIDLAPAMIEALADDVVAAGLAGRVEVRVGDAQDPGLPPASVDVVASSLVLFFLPDPLGALVTWRQALVPGGRVGVSTFGAYNDEWRAVDEVFRPYLPPQMVDARTREGGPFASDENMERLLADAGFTDVRTATRTARPRFEDADHWYAWSMSAGQRHLWDSVPEAERPAVRAEAARRLEGCRDDEGRIGFDQVVRYTLAHR